MARYSAYRCTDIAKKNIILVGTEGLLSLAQQIKTFLDAF